MRITKLLRVVCVLFPLIFGGGVLVTVRHTDAPDPPRPPLPPAAARANATPSAPPPAPPARTAEDVAPAPTPAPGRTAGPEPPTPRPPANAVPDPAPASPVPGAEAAREGPPRPSPRVPPSPEPACTGDACATPPAPEPITQVDWAVPAGWEARPPLHLLEDPLWAQHATQIADDPRKTVYSMRDIIANQFPADCGSRRMLIYSIHSSQGTFGVFSVVNQVCRCGFS